MANQPPVLVPSCLVSYMRGGKVVRVRYVGTDAARLARAVPNSLSLVEGQVALTDPDKVQAAGLGTWCEEA